MDSRRRATGRRMRTRARSVSAKRHIAEELAKLSDDVKRHLLDDWRNLQERRREDEEKLADDIAVALGWRIIEGRVVDRLGREIIGYDERDNDSSTRLKP